MGEGEFGPVVLGWAYNISPLERSEVAVKVIHAHNAGTHRAVLLDFASQMQLQNPNICGILGLCTDVEPYYVIYEYLDKVRDMHGYVWFVTWQLCFNREI